MKSFATLAFLASPCAAQYTSGSTIVNDLEYIESLNSVPDSLWKAAPQERFDGMTFDDVRGLMGTRLSHISEHLDETLHDDFYAAIADVPDAFDARTEWKELIHPIRDQQQCGSCWAFSSSEVLSDRVAIAQKKPSPVLSPEDMVSCDKKDDGCQGGSLPDAWSYLKNTGIVTDSCMPYSAGGGKAPKCTKKCADSESFTRTHAKSAYAINGVVNMQKDIVTSGPIQIGFQVYRSFMSYKSGVYHKHKHEGQPEGGHAVKIVGYGTDAGKDYWVVANSWGVNWGEEGFFRMLRGKNECGIEKMGPPYAGLPAIADEDLIVV